MGFRKFGLHPVELRAVFQIAGARGARVGIAGAIEREELSQAAVGEIVIARGFVLWKREVVQDGREIAMALGFVSVVVAECREEGNSCEQRLVGLEELGTPILVARATMPEAKAQAADICVYVVSQAEQKADGIACAGTA